MSLDTNTWRFMVVISRVISRVTLLITHIMGLETPLITTPEPPSRIREQRRAVSWGFRAQQAYSDSRCRFCGPS